jgi:hypothetical protein
MTCNTLLTTVILLIAQTVLAAEGETKPAADKRPTKIWNRTGPLGETPKHVTDAYPLSDQDNKGGWVKFEPMSDEFDGQELDPSKWNRGMYWWKGRQPALFSDKNVTVSDGKLHLTMRKEKLPAEAEKQGYKDYTSAALHTKVRSGYGYYEVKAKPMNSGGSGSFWFQLEDVPGWLTEIDVNAVRPRFSFLVGPARDSPAVWEGNWPSGATWGEVSAGCRAARRRRFLRRLVGNTLLSCVGREAWSDLTRGGGETRPGSPLTAGPRWRCSRNSDFSHGDGSA